jgi:hypothetical protein
MFTATFGLPESGSGPADTWVIVNPAASQLLYIYIYIYIYKLGACTIILQTS